MRRSLVLSVVALVALAGCVADTTDGGGALPEGLTVLDAEEGALSLAYRSGDVLIYMEALRGQPTAPEYQQDSQSPRFEVDARFTDDAGYVFYSQQGGDGWLEPAWSDDLDRQIDDRPTATSNEALFEVAGEAAAVMRAEIEAQVGADLAAALAPEIRALHTFAERAPTEYALQLERVNTRREQEGLPLVDVEDGDVAYGSDKGGADSTPTDFGAGYYYIAVHDASISSTLGLGRHSSTALYRWQNGAWLHVHNTCNHGRCGTEMSRKCLLQYYESSTNYHPVWSLRSCSTGYDTFSDGGGHNCHDDTRVQMHNFVYNSLAGGSRFWCNGNDDSTDISSWPGDQSGSPECDQFGDKGYHHRPHMCDYNWDRSCSDSWQGTSDGCDCGCTFPDGTGADPDCG